MRQGYRFMEHTADFRLEIFGRDAADLFIQAARALADLLTDPVRLQGRHRRTLTILGDDWPDLMVNWLRELLYLWNGEEELVCDASPTSLEPTRLVADVATDAYNPHIHAIRNEIKAVTYHQIEAGPHEAGWRARVIFDI